MKLEDALKKKILRPVEVSPTGYPLKYADKEFEDYKKFIGQTIVLINVANKFIMKKDADLAKVTFTADNKKSFVYIDNQKILNAEDKPKKSDFAKVTLTKAVLSANIVNLSDIYEDILVSNFSEMAVNVLDGKPLTKKQVISLMLDHRTANVFEIDTILKLTKDVELIEIVKKTTPRARLLIQEVKDGNNKPLSAKYFKNKNLKSISPLS